jgi:hypothetical protein
MAIAKRKLKAPTEPILRKTKAEMALAEAKLELNTLQERHRQAVAAQLADEASNTTSVLKRDVGLAVEKRKLAHKLEVAADETERLAAIARAERGKTPQAQGDWRSAQRRRGLSLLALRAGNREVAALRKQGLTGPGSLVYGPGGHGLWDDLLLNGRIGRAYLQELAQAGILTQAELREDDAE